MITRGIRNNNPFNIRKSNLNNWKGKLRPGTDKDFEQFESMELGLRAGIILLRNYIVRYNLCTVYGIIKRFAPPSENNTAAYINYVYKQFVSYGKSGYIDLGNRQSIFILCASILKFESDFVLDPDVFDKICNKYKIFSKYEKC